MPGDRPPSLESVFWVKLKWANSMGKSKHNRNCAPKYVDVVVRMWEMSVGRLRRYRCVLEEWVWILSHVILLTTGGGEDCWGHNGPFNNAFFFFFHGYPSPASKTTSHSYQCVGVGCNLFGSYFFSGQTMSSSICHAGLFIGTLPLNTTVLVRHNFFFFFFL